jgi:hypothetical protein
MQKNRPRGQFIYTWTVSWICFSSRIEEDDFTKQFKN